MNVWRNVTTVVILVLFPIRPCVYSCWQPWELWLARLAPYWPRAWAPRRPPGSCRSPPAGSFTSPRWPCSQNFWRAAPVSASPWWRFWPCCLESAWWCWSPSTSETQQSGREQRGKRSKRLEKMVVLSRVQVDYYFIRGVFSSFLLIVFWDKHHPLMANGWFLFCVCFF